MSKRGVVAYTSAENAAFNAGAASLSAKLRAFDALVAAVDAYTHSLNEGSVNNSERMLTALRAARAATIPRSQGDG